MKVVFLDIDGVLNGHEMNDHPHCKSYSINKKSVKHLNFILDETGAKIVVSSAWRYMVHGGAMTLQGFEYLLRTHYVACAGRILDVTPRDEQIALRGEQIRAWLNSHRVESYVVLDNLDLGITACGHPFVQTDGNEGLTRQQAIQAVKILKGEAVAA